MHPSRTFRWTDREAMLAFVGETSFAHLFAHTPDGPLVAYAPLLVTPEGNLRFHLARANRISKHLDGAEMLASVTGAHAYISPDWYGSDDQVPTWNYVAVEARGIVRRVGEAELIDILDALSAVHEAPLAPKKPWTRDKMRPGLFEGLLKSLIGFELTVSDLNGVRKLGQNKNIAEIEGAAAALTASGQKEMAALMRDAGA